MTIGSGETGALGVVGQAFQAQESAGLISGLVLRLIRRLAGDPISRISATSASSAAPAGLPAQADATSALLYVSDNSIFYRLDGTNPAAGADTFIPQGSYVILTGQPSIQGFKFVSQAATAANVYGTYFT